MTVTCRHEGLNRWIAEVVAICRPERIHWCDGSREEYDRLMALMIENGTAIPLKKRPNSFLFRSDPGDVARIGTEQEAVRPLLQGDGGTVFDHEGHQAVVLFLGAVAPVDPLGPAHGG